MVNQVADLDTTFTALGDATRRAILTRLALGETSVSELAGPFSMSLPAVLKHVEALQRAGLLEARKQGRVRRCRLAAAPLAKAAEWIGRYQRFWEARFDGLERYLHATASKEDDRWPPRKTARRSRSGSRAASRRRESGSSAPGPTRRR